MTTRIPRLWQPGCPRARVFLPDFWMKLIEQPKKGYMRLPKYAAAFEIDLRMSRFDVREYLENIYKYPVRDVRTFVKMGHIEWDHPKDREKRKALLKDEDKKIAIVFFRKDFVAEIPKLCPQSGASEELEEMKRRQNEDLNLLNKRIVNKDRAGIGENLPL